MAPVSFVYDGAVEFTGGQDASKVPDRVPENAYFAGVNVTSQRGVLGPRFGFRESDELIFPSGGIELPNRYIRTYEEIYRSGKFQASIPYSVGRDFYVIVIVSGVIFLKNIDNNLVTVIEIEGKEKLNEHSDRINWSVAGRFLVLFDFPSYPVIIEGFSARRADPEEFEVPISVLGAYNQNRLFIGNAGNEFTAGDPAGSLATPDAPITFNEVLAPSAPYFGQIFQLPSNFGNDTLSAMTFLQSVDTSTGIGPLLVSTQTAIFSYNTQNPRANWEAGQFGSNFTFEVGIAGPKAFTHVNSDLFFLGSDGQVRSLSMSREEQRKWAKMPLSREVQNWLKYTDIELVRFGSMAYFRNKVFVTANPYRTIARDTIGNRVFDYVHGGMVVLELDNIASLAKESFPSWAGLWTGIRPIEFCGVNNRLFFIGKRGLSNVFVEVTPERTTDYIGGVTKKVISQVYTREYTFNDEFQNKDMQSINLALENVEGALQLDLKYKPSNSPMFLDWVTFRHTAQVNICSADIMIALNGLAPHSFRELNLGAPQSDSDCDPISETRYSFFRKMQMYFRISADYWELHGYKISAVIRPESNTDVLCDPFPDVLLQKRCDSDWSIEEDSICQIN